jgi:hypothetical protein
VADFVKIRKEHDRIYTEQAFMDEAARNEIENFSHPNGFFETGGSVRNPRMRQLKRDASGFVCVSTTAEPQSDYLSELSTFFSTMVLDELGSLLALLPAEADEASVKAAVRSLQSSDDVQRLRDQYGEQLWGSFEDESSTDVVTLAELKAEPAFHHLELAAKLALLLLKKRRANPGAAETPLTLWEDIWRRTDQVRYTQLPMRHSLKPTPSHCSQVYLATEDLKDVFERVVRALIEKLGEGVELKFGSLKARVCPLPPSVGTSPTSPPPSLRCQPPHRPFSYRIQCASMRRRKTTTKTTLRTRSFPKRVWST